MYGKELELVLDVLRGEQRAVAGAAGEPADVLGAVDDLQVPGRVHEAGVAGAVPAVGAQDLRGRLGILVVLLQQPRRADQDLAAVGHLDLDAFDRHADGVGARLVVGLQADEHRGLGRAVELLQVDAERAVEGEEVRADRLAGGVGDAHPGKAQRVAQRRVDQDLAEGVAQAVERADGLAVHQRRPDPARQRHRPVEQPALQPAGVFHADHHAGEQALEDARRREVVGRADLLQVDRHRACRLRAVDDVAADQPLRVGEDVLADPGGRQVGEHLVVGGELVEAGAGRGAVDQGLVGMDDTLRIAGRAGGEEQRGDVGGLRLGDLGLEEAGMLLVPGAAGRDQRVERREAGLAVVAQSSRVVVPDARDPRARGAHLDHLVDLLLVLDDRESDLGIARSGTRTRSRRHPGRAAPASRRAPASPASPHRAAAGSRRSRPGAGRACSPASARPQAIARTSAASSLQLSVCQMPKSFSRNAGAEGRRVAWSSRRRGKVGDTINLSNEGRRARGPRVNRDSRKILTPSCRSDDNLRDNTLGCIPRPARRQALIETVPVKLDTAVSPPPGSGRTTSIR